MKKIFLITFILLASNLFAESWIFNSYGEKDKTDTPHFLFLFSSKIEAEEWLSKSNRKPAIPSQIPAQLVAVLYVELVENAGNIVFDTAFGKAQAFGNYFVGQVLGY